MTTLALALAALLAAGEPSREPPPSPPPAPEAAAPEPGAPAPLEPPTAPLPEAAPQDSAAREPPVDEEGAEQPAGEPAAGAPSSPAPTSPSPRRPEATDWTPPSAAMSPSAPAAAQGPGAPFSREYAILAGWNAISLAGLGARGPNVRLALSTPSLPSVPGVAVVSTEIFAGSTEAGLRVRSAKVDVELWLASGPRVRLGGGLGLGLVGYRRETRGEWPVMLVPGARVGVEVAALRWSGGAIVLGAHASGHIGDEAWLSASLGVGYRSAAAPRASPPAAAPDTGAIRAE